MGEGLQLRLNQNRWGIRSFVSTHVVAAAMNDETFFCLALVLVPGLGNSGLNQMIRHYGSAAEVLKLSAEELTRCGCPSEARGWICGGLALGNAEKTVRTIQDKGIGVLSIFDPDYPHRLKEIFDPPLILYFLGDPKNLHLPSIAIVGSRRCSIYGKEVTQKLSRELSALGICVVSGLARGIDSQAHIGALAGGGTTVAVLGNGVDVVYPRENRKLYQRIQEQGCVISEFPCSAFPAPQNFPIRNRIISGLCYGTLISEAAEFSGSLITARLTLEQNRELWAIPGNVTRTGSYGPNYLIKQGARVVIDVQDILEEMPPYALDSLRGKKVESSSDSASQLSPSEERVLNFLSVDASTHVDELVDGSGLDLSKLTGILLQLEMKGLVRQLPGRKFSRKLL